MAVSKQVVNLENEGDTDRLGAVLAVLLPPGSVVSLVGPLGAGKTRLVQAIAQELGVSREEVTSPTFVLVNEYRGGTLPLYHFDAYRLRDEDEFLQLGPDEYFESQGLTFVEWGDRVAACLPRDCCELQIEVLEGEKRRVTLSDPTGKIAGEIRLA